MKNITYTFAQDCPVIELRGITANNGIFNRIMQNKKMVDVVTFKNLLDSPVHVGIAGKPELQKLFDAKIAAEKTEDAQRLLAHEIYTKTPEGQREILEIEAENTYSENYFPGTTKWFKHQDACEALKAFDAAHPEMVARINAKRKADDAARYDALSDFVKNGS